MYRYHTYLVSGQVNPNFDLCQIISVYLQIDQDLIMQLSLSAPLSTPLSIQQETVSPDLKAPFPSLSHAISEYNPDNRRRWHAGQ